MNLLAHETSPYLKQHQHNPVNWMPWGEAAWQKARDEDKLVLISIGYSACHWCHVMERESFEDEETAALMNEHFICIKVDREERPDVDQVYMEAIQLMHGQGGWPLNCFALPDGRPVHGGTYFKNETWRKMLEGLAVFYQDNKDKALDYASRMQEAVLHQQKIVSNTTEYTVEKLDSLVLQWQNYFDVNEGGQDRSPKFPLPNNYSFLLKFGSKRKSNFILNFVHLTLQKMARGGIFDQIGGGFARYSVDRLWHVPHFEKMLYDNAQLISLYSEAYRQSKYIPYKTVVDDTIQFVLRELTHEQGGFYSALDADSEGVEGKFYTWTSEEFLEALAGVDFVIPKLDFYLTHYFQITIEGNWIEEETNILKCDKSIAEFCEAHTLDPVVFEADLLKAKEVLMQRRSFRVRPGLDDKIITSWNALMVKALVDAYDATHQTQYLKEAKKHYQFICQKLVVDGQLKHTFHYSIQEAKIDAFLDDYAMMADAAIALYQATFNEMYLEDARKWVDTVILNFSSEDSPLFYYNNATSDSLFVRKVDFLDNVIPASNSVLAKVLCLLGRYFENHIYTSKYQEMLAVVRGKFMGYPSGYSQWLQLQLLETIGLTTVVILEEEAISMKREFDEYYLPNVIYAGGTDATIAITEGKDSKQGKSIHVCTAMACMPAVANVKEAMELLNVQ